MSKRKKESNIIEETGLSPENWHVLDAAPIIPGHPLPGATPPAPNAMPPHFVGTLNPDMQHDAIFSGTQNQNPRIPCYPLMPTGPAGKPQTNAAIRSVVKTNQTATSAAASSSGLNFRGTWQSFIVYNTNDIVIWDQSTYVALTGSNNLRPDQNSSNWTLLSENLVFNPTPTNLALGGFGPFDTAFVAQGNSATVSISGTPSVAAEIAVFGITVNNTTTVTLPAGWHVLFQYVAGAAANSYLFYKILSDASPVSVSASLSGSTLWSAHLSLFKFGGFVTGNITQVQIAGNVATITCANDFQAGNIISIQKLMNASFLNDGTSNGVGFEVLSANSSQFTIGFTHANYGPTADTGIAIKVGQQVSNVTVSGAGSPDANPFNNLVQQNSVFANVFAAVSGTATSPTCTDTNGNAYNVVDSSQANCVALIGYSSPNKIAGGNPGISPSSTLTWTGGAVGTAYLLELAGSAPIYEPYDVVQFRGSMFVCLQETSLDAFTAPSAWALIGPGIGYVNIQSANYTVVAADAGHLISFNSSSARTLTLPNPVPAPPAGTQETGWWIPVQNIGTGTLTISPNGLNIDGASGNLTLGQNQGILIFADSTGNYETHHGVNVIVVPGIFTVTAPNGSGVVTIGLATESANTVWSGPTSGGAAAPTFRSLVNADLPATTPTVPPGFSVTGNVASPAGAFGLILTSEPANTLFAGPVSGAPAPPTFRALVSSDIPPGALPPTAIAEAVGTLITTSASGVLRLPGNVIPPAGVYRVCVNFYMQANPSAGNLDVAVGWNDGTATRSATNGTLGAPADISTAALNVAQGKIVVVSDGIHDITWSMTLT
jgi:hypothetical protein